MKKIKENSVKYPRVKRFNTTEIGKFTNRQHREYFLQDKGKILSINPLVKRLTWGFAWKFRWKIKS